MPATPKPYPTRDDLGDAFLARFWAKVAIVQGECWLWQAGTDGKGYGVIGYRYRVLLAHRVAYSIHHGSVPQALVLHECDVQRCCNPDHLHLGDHDRNMAEASERSRLPRRLGAANHMAKLTQEQADELRSLYGTLNKSQLSRRFGVSCPVVRKILRGESYPVQGK
jgi:hypothetical protein